MSFSLLDLNEVCRRLAASRSTVLRLVARGDLPAPVKISGRRQAWLEHEINNWIESRAAGRGGDHG